MEHDKSDIKHILNVLRRGTITWKKKHYCLQKSKTKKKVGKLKNGKDKFKTFYKCEQCKKEFDYKEVQVDHKEEIGTFNGNFDDYVKRMYCSEDNLQVLCISCHLVKTSRFNASLRYERKKK